MRSFAADRRAWLLPALYDPVDPPRTRQQPVTLLTFSTRSGGYLSKSERLRFRAKQIRAADQGSFGALYMRKITAVELNYPEAGPKRPQ
jgi:hypothetical protein